MGEIAAALVVVIGTAVTAAVVLGGRTPAPVPVRVRGRGRGPTGR
jgi:hypothetical protein